MNTKTMLLAMTALLGLSACSSDADEPRSAADGRVPILLSASPAVTRAGQDIQNTQFYKGEEMDVQITAQNGRTTYEQLLYYTSNNSGTLVPKGGVYPYYPTDKSPVNIVAVYPAGNIKASTFTVRSPQVAEADYMASDLMLATLAGVATPDTETTHELNFKHMLCKVQVNLTGEGGVNLNDSQVTLMGVKVQTSFSARTGTVSEEGQGTNTDILISRDGSVPCAAVVVPQSVPSGYLLQIVLANNDILNYRTTQSTVYESGKVYTYNVKVIESDITVSTTVSDWDYDADTDTQEYARM